jgi:hypothetical protein
MMPHCRNALDPKSAENLYAQGACVGTIVGIAFVAVSLNALSPSDENVRRELCINPSATGTRGQLVRTVVAYIDARSARMHENFGVLAPRRRFEPRGPAADETAIQIAPPRPGPEALRRVFDQALTGVEARASGAAR